MDPVILAAARRLALHRGDDPALVCAAWVASCTQRHLSMTLPGLDTAPDETFDVQEVLLRWRQEVSLPVGLALIQLRRARLPFLGSGDGG